MFIMMDNMFPICAIILTVTLATLVRGQNPYPGTNLVPTGPPVNPINYPRPPVPTPYAAILQQNFDMAPDGSSYQYGFQSEDGTAKTESGQLKPPVAPGADPAMEVHGSYIYYSREGIPVEVNYIANEFGFQPSGPSIHPAIQKAVALQVAQAQGQNPVPVPPTYAQPGFPAAPAYPTGSNVPLAPVYPTVAPAPGVNPGYPAPQNYPGNSGFPAPPPYPTRFSSPLPSPYPTQIAYNGPSTPAQSLKK